MATDDLMYYCLQLSLFINGGFVAFALGKTALTRPGTVAILALASFVAAFCAGFLAPHFTVLDSPAGRAYCLYTAAGRFSWWCSGWGHLR